MVMIVAHLEQATRTHKISTMRLPLENPLWTVHFGHMLISSTVMYPYF